MPTTIDLESQRMLLGSTPVRKLYHGANLIGARIAELFAGGVPGVWFDPSELSTLFQDAAGTLPVTAMEQPVGLMLDKSGWGNHASQATTTARPVVSARYNLLQDTMFQDATTTRKWANLGLIITPTYGTHVAPDGTMTAVTLTSTGGSPTCYQSFPVTALPFVVSFYARLGGTKPTTTLTVRNATTATNVSSGGFNNSTGAVSGVGWSRTDVGGGWYRVQTTLSTGFSVGDTVTFYIGFTGTSSAAGESCIVWGPDIRLSVDTLNLPVYQRVTSATDYDTVGFSPYLRFDGVDDFLDAGTLDFSAATQSAAVIGVKKLSDAIVGLPYSHGLMSQNGAFRFLAPANPGQASVRAAARGADGGLKETVGTNDKAAPIKLVLCSTYGAGAPVSIRYNGTESRVSSGALGALTLPSARSVIGAQVTGGTTQSSFFLGRIYGLAHIARALSLSEQRILEQFMRNKSRAY